MKKSNKYYILMVNKDYNEHLFDTADRYDTKMYAVEIEAPTKIQAIFKAYYKYPNMKVW